MNRKSAAFLIVAVLIVQGCSALTSYTKHTSMARKAMLDGQYTNALAAFPQEETKGGDAILMLMERGTILQALGQFPDSSKEFESASGKINDIQNRAVISASRAAQQAGSILVNEKMLSYEGYDFEIIFLHTLDALNYLMLGDIENARVEIRNSYTWQKKLYDQNYNDIQKAKKDSKGYSWSDYIGKSSDPAAVNAMVQKAGGTVSVYQNAFAYYISSIVYELGGEPDEAYIDMKKAIDAAPECKAVQRDLVRLARINNYQDDVRRLEDKYGKLDMPVKGGIDIVYIQGIGLAPVREEIKFPVPTGSGWVFAAFPVYVPTPSFILGGVLNSSTMSDSTTILCSTDAIASKNLTDDYPVIFAKQIIRSVAKGYSNKELKKQFGDWGALAGTLYSAVTEQADLRTWTTLPKQVQVARMFVPAGTLSVSVASIPTGNSFNVDIPPKAKHVIIFSRNTERVLTVYSKAYNF